MNKTRIFSILTALIALGLAGYLVYSIKSEIDNQKKIKVVEKAVIERLKLIRDAEKAYQSVYGEYTDNWDTLINFIEHGQYPITRRTEHVIELDYGADSSYVVIDTIDIVPVKDFIFYKRHEVYATTNGTFGEYFVQEGDYVVKGSKIYSMTSDITGKKTNQLAKNTGRVTNLKPKKEGDRVHEGELLFIQVEELYDPNIDIAQLPYIPYTDPPLKFDIYADKIERNHLTVNVIEVRDVAPINPMRSEDNEANNKKPLRFGSRTEVTTAGNWE